MDCFLAAFKGCCIDNKVFVLHYRLTVFILVVCAIIAAWQKSPSSNAKGPIDCTNLFEKGTPQAIIESHCWSLSYIVVPKALEVAFDKKQYEDSKFNSLEQLKSSDSKYESYFPFAHRWIELILLVQAFLFYLPRYIWRNHCEHGRIQALSENYCRTSLKKDFSGSLRRGSSFQYHTPITDAVHFLRTNRHENLAYSLKFALCEVLNFANVLTQCLILRCTLGLTWLTLEEFLSLDTTSDVQLDISRTFPTHTVCQFTTPTSRGGRGTTTTEEMCVISSNVVNRKIYIFLWLYLYLLTIVSGLAVLYRLLTILSPGLRYGILKFTGKPCCESVLKTANSHGLVGYGEWFLMHQLSKNMDMFSFGNFVNDYCSDVLEAQGTPRNKLYPNLSAISLHELGAPA